MCLRNLFRRRVRTSLCILGIALGVMLIVAVGATTMKYMDVIMEMNVFYRGKVVVVAKDSIFIQALPIGGGSLQETTVNEVRLVKGVKTAVPMLSIIGPSKNGGFVQFVPLNISFGIPVGNWSVLVGSAPLKPSGRWPSVNSNEKEAVIGGYLAEHYNLKVNSKIKIKNYDLKVVGILDTPSVLLSRVIIMPLKVAQDVYGKHMMINMIVVEPKEGLTEAEVGQRIETKFQYVDALTSDERNEIVMPLLHDVETWNLGISVVIFLMSMVLVMTVATMNTSERRKEISTLDAMGASKTTIVRIVITETGLIGLLGGIAGILLGAFASLLLASFYANVPLSVMFPSLFFIVPPTMMIEILVLTVVLSCIAGVVPAVVAARKSIAESLRSE